MDRKLVARCSLPSRQSADRRASCAAPRLGGFHFSAFWSSPTAYIAVSCSRSSMRSRIWPSRDAPDADSRRGDAFGDLPMSSPRIARSPPRPSRPSLIFSPSSASISSSSSALTRSLAVRPRRTSPLRAAPSLLAPSSSLFSVASLFPSSSSSPPPPPPPSSSSGSSSRGLDCVNRLFSASAPARFSCSDDPRRRNPKSGAEPAGATRFGGHVSLLPPLISRGCPHRASRRR